MSDASAPRDDITSEILLAQGDELLRSSRDLLEELDDVVDLRDVPGTD